MLDSRPHVTVLGSLSLAPTTQRPSYRRVAVTGLRASLLLCLAWFGLLGARVSLAPQTAGTLAGA